MRTMLARSLAALLGLAALSCSGVPSSGAEEGDAALRRGDPEKAFTIYREALAARPGDALLVEKTEIAREAAAERHLDRAREFAGSGDLPAARQEIALAREWLPGDERIDAAESELDAKSVRDTAGVEAAISRARAAQAAGRVGEALDVLARARSGYGPVPSLVSEDLAIRSRAGATLTARGDAELAAGRAALAWVLYRAAGDVTRRMPAGLARAEAALGRAADRTVTVGSLEDRTRGRISAARFAEEVRDALSVRLPSPGWTIGAGGASFRLSGAVTSVEVAMEPPRTERRTVEHVVRVEQRENGERRRLEARVRDLENRSRQARGVHAAAADELASLERLSGSAQVRAQGDRRYGPYGEAAYYRYLGDARTREADARNRMDQIETDLRDARDRLSSEPVWIENPVTARAPADVTTRSKTGSATADLLLVTPSGESRVTVSGEASASDETHDPIPSAGIPADPLELPSDAEVAARAVTALAGAVADAIAARATESCRGLLDEARRREGAGDAAGALDAYAALLLAAGDGLPLDRGIAAGEIERRLGIRMAGPALDLRNLRLD